MTRLRIAAAATMVSGALLTAATAHADEPVAPFDPDTNIAPDAPPPPMEFALVPPAPEQLPPAPEQLPPAPEQLPPAPEQAPPVEGVSLGEPAPEAVPVAEPVAPQRTWSLDWNAVAACESGSNWSINTGNGYSGGLQWLPSTWRAYKAPDAPNAAHQATKEQQVDAAERLYAQSGRSPWPVCGKLG